MKKIVYTGIFTMTICIIVISIYLLACNGGSETPESSPPAAPDAMSFTIQKVLPHDTSLFTEGLLIYKGSLYESTGDFEYTGKSKLLKIDPVNWQVVAKADLTYICNKIRQKDPKADFLNGIAYDPETKKVYITGKKWPDLYEIQFSK